MILFESNCISVALHLSKDSNDLNSSKITTLESICLLFHISKDANSVDPDQTAPIGAV